MTTGRTSSAGAKPQRRNSSLAYDQLEEGAAEVLRHLRFHQKEVQTKEGEWRQVRISPYRTAQIVIDCVVLTFIDIHRLKKAEEAAQQARHYADCIVGTIREPLVVLHESLRMLSANRAFYRAFRTSAEKVKRKRIYEVGGGQWNLPGLRKLLGEILPCNTVLEDFRVESRIHGLGHKSWLLNARRLAGESGDPGRILLVFEEVTGGHEPGRKSLARGRGGTP